MVVFRNFGKHASYFNDVLLKFPFFSIYRQTIISFAGFSWFLLLKKLYINEAYFIAILTHKPEVARSCPTSYYMKELFVVADNNQDSLLKIFFKRIVSLPVTSVIKKNKSKISC